MSDFRLPGRSAQRLNGAYYTRHAPAEVMARWVIRSTGDRILEPAFGDGSFLRALVGAGVSLFGAELAADSYTAAVAAGLLPADQSFLGDFLALKPFDVDAIIGNPPGALGLIPGPKLDDPRKLKQSLRKLLDYDFDVLLLCDGQPLLSGGKQKVAEFLSTLA